MISCHCVGGGLQQRSSHCNAGIGHHHIQTAEVPDVCRHGRLHAVRIGHIHRQAEGDIVAAQTRDQLIHLGL